MLLPTGIMVAAILVIMTLDTGASAAEFAALGIMLGTVVVTPLVLLINLAIAFREADTRMECFKRGMLVPGIVILGAVIRQIGLWDAFT